MPQTDPNNDNDHTAIGLDSKPTIYGIHNNDARKLDDVIKGKLIDVTITSPPYFDLKDYGHEQQIWFVQNLKYSQGTLLQ